MRVHTRTHHTKNESWDENTGAISADDLYERVYGNFPRWALSVSGLRYREDLTQKELAELIGVKQSNISQMERGVRPIGKEIAKRLAKVFKTDYRRFL